MIAKFRYHSENSVIAKIEIFAMHSNFCYDSENSSVAKFPALFHWLLFPFSLLQFSSVFCSSFLFVSDL